MTLIVSSISDHYATLAPRYDALVYPEGCAWIARQVGAVADALGLSAGARFLDVGGGTGTFALALERATGANGVVLDPSAQMLRYAALKLGPTRTLLGTLTSATPAERRFDAVLLKECVHHVPASGVALQRCYDELLTASGRLCVVVARLVGPDVPSEIRRLEEELVPTTDGLSASIPSAGHCVVTRLLAPRVSGAQWRARIRGRSYSYLRDMSTTDLAALADRVPEVATLRVREELTILVWSRGDRADARDVG